MRVLAYSIALMLICGGLVAEASVSAPERCFGLRVTIIGTPESDRLVGTPGDDVMFGGDGSDLLLGGGGDDVMCGGYGRDVLRGGRGDDHLGEWALAATHLGGPGSDRIEGNGVMYGGSGDDSLSVNRGTASGGAGDDYLKGRQLVGNLGDDTLEGTSFAFAYYSNARSSVTVDLGRALAFGEGRDKLIHIEGVRGSPHGDRLIGTPASDYLLGFGGRDHIIGGGGPDRLEGGADSDIVEGGDGRDTLLGDTYDNKTDDGDDVVLGERGSDYVLGAGGDDALDGGGGVDTTSFHDAPNGVNVDLAEGVASGWGEDQVLSVEDVSGSSFSDVLKGDDGPNSFGGIGFCGCPRDSDQVEGRGGDDTFFPRYGSNQISGGPGNDLVSYAWGYESVQVDLTTGRVSGYTSGRLMAVETIIGTMHSDRITGSGADEELFGEGGDDQVHGGGGDDTVSGDCDAIPSFHRGRADCEGADHVSGDSGADEVHGGVLNDVLDGGFDKDRLFGGLGVDLCLNGESVEDCES